MNNEHIPEFFLEKYSADHIIQDDKYFYFYKHISIDADNLVFGIFKNTELKYNYACNFNDPYDCLFKLELSNLDNLTKDEFESITGKSVNNAEWQLSRKFIIKKFKEMHTLLLNQEIHTLRKKVPITCFNSNPLNILMWSHYADHHKGLMLEFKISKDFSEKLCPIPVSYNNTFPIIQMSLTQLKNFSESNKSNINYDIIEKALLRKSDCWFYENEYRAFGDENDSLLIKYNPSILSSVITGTKFRSTNKYKLLKDSISLFNKTNKTNVKIYDAKLMDDRYELYVDQHPRLDKK
ncbi:DUF2971 domain-containing protein [Acinetobacter sp. SwsAc6]|uniref:DUF2971 domain-containing protein n=1 Tax=Acinetobacter sp. SwsAc6 TaxID=2749439 RepID=UPI0015BFB16C|nr:DUF2971 domain-containing protein [Acinetobacter sp. SwsAc6]NWK73147.1 DUF2971 domain-containing protein [Acinetobacter sp. SwsAc6]